ncbi:hypothetical protein CMO96_00345 [Candidatus Woesebacteria bacterium]|nr:hypothetical protein [Candidatus Woesebacteria bacterium]
MTEEERKKTILELEQSVCKFPTKAENLKIDSPDEECEVCGAKLENNECREHSTALRMHRRAIRSVRNNYK